MSIPQYTDTHTHLYLDDFEDGGRQAVERALQAGVSRMLLPAITAASAPAMLALKQEWPHHLWLAMGLHPTDLGPDPRGELQRVKAELATGAYQAVGEVGVDLYWEQSREQEQMQAFDEQCRWARELGLPVIVHCREALPQVLEVIGGHPGLTGIMHCFSGTAAEVELTLKRAPGFMFGIGGTVTYKRSTLPQALPAIPPHLLVLETDSPYLAPVPKRGRRNESSYMPYTAACVASILGKPVEAIAAETTANALRLLPPL